VEGLNQSRSLWPTVLRNISYVWIVKYVCIRPLFSDIVIRLFKQIRCFGRANQYDFGDIRSQQKRPVRRKCSNCGSRLLYDALPRYTNDIVPKYISRNLKGGSGLPPCKATIFQKGFAIPLESTVPFTRNQKR